MAAATELGRGARERSTVMLRGLAIGTVYEPDDERGPFALAGPSVEPSDFRAISFELEQARPAVRRRNAPALRELALEVLSEPAYLDPNVSYAREVLSRICRDLCDRDRITSDDWDQISQAFDQGVMHATRAVASAWLDERGSLPIPR